MAENSLEINVNEYVKKAFYSIPAFCDVEGEFVSGAYGAMFKLVNELKQVGHLHHLIRYRYGLF